MGKLNTFYTENFRKSLSISACQVLSVVMQCLPGVKGCYTSFEIFQEIFRRYFLLK